MPFDWHNKGFCSSKSILLRACPLADTTRVFFEQMYFTGSMPFDRHNKELCSSKNILQGACPLTDTTRSFVRAKIFYREHALWQTQQGALFEQKYFTGSMPFDRHNKELCSSKNILQGACPLTDTTRSFVRAKIFYREHALWQTQQGALFEQKYFTGSMPFDWNNKELCSSKNILQGACPLTDTTRSFVRAKIFYREHALWLAQQGSFSSNNILQGTCPLTVTTRVFFEQKYLTGSMPFLTPNHSF